MNTALSLPEPHVRPMVSVRSFDEQLGLTLNEQGIICDCEMSGLLGYRLSDLAWQHISALLPELAGIQLMTGDTVNPRVRFLSRIGYRFQLIGQGGKTFLGELFIRVIENSGKPYLRALVLPVVGGQNDGALSIA